LLDRVGGRHFLLGSYCCSIIWCGAW